jgi:hypothetical protein
MSRIGHNEVILASAIKDLNRDWATTVESWQDLARQEFEEAFLQELLAAAKTAAGAMGEISRLMDQAVQECS